MTRVRQGLCNLLSNSSKFTEQGTISLTVSRVTEEGREWVDEANIKSVLLRHYPELAKTGLANVDNAFEPWDTDRELDEHRHPLRKFIRDLAPNHMIGDSYR